MYRNIRRRARRSLVAAGAAALSASAVPAAAGAQVTSDMNDWNLTESVSTYGGGTQFHRTSGWPSADFRWLDVPDKTTVISGNNCSDYSSLGGATFPAYSTAYGSLFSSSAFLCFVMRGRTAIGQGSMVNHDGRSRR